MKKTFTAKLQAGGRGGTAITIPFDVEQTFGSSRVKIKATFDGEPYRGSIVKVGGRHVLGVTKAIRESIGKDVGDSIRVTVEKDGAERSVNVPRDLANTLMKNPRAKKQFDAMAFTYRKEFARWIDTAKKQDTRDRRLAKAIDMLERGERL